MPAPGNMDDVKAFSYDCAKAGKAPQIGRLPKKGNGPVKLATSRQVATGELRITNETPDKTLQTIKGGQYVVGMKARPLSTVLARSAHSIADKSVKAQPDPERPTLTAGALQLDTPEVCISQFYPSQDRDMPSPPTDDSTVHVEALGLGLSTATKLLEELRTARSCASLARLYTPSALSGQSVPPDAPSTTLQALRKAEYGRLVAIYGQEDTDRSIARLEETRSSMSKSRSYSPLAFDSLPRPFGEFGSPDGRLSTTSTSEGGATWSDVSSQRDSALSIYTESSVTARSSVVEDDVSASRDEVHRLVTQMRYTYLTAIEDVAPCATKASKPRRKRKSSRKSTRSSKSASVAQMQKVDPTHARIAIMRRWSWPAALPCCTTGDRKRARSVDANTSGTSNVAQVPRSLDEHTTTRPNFPRGDSTTLGEALHLVQLSQTESRSESLNPPRPVESTTANVNVESTSTRFSIDMPEINLDLVRDRSTLDTDCARNSTAFEDLDDICDAAYRYDSDDQKTWSVEPSAWRKNFAPSISSIYSESSSYMNARPRASITPSELRVPNAADCSTAA